MSEILSADNYVLRWYDPEQSILLLEVLSRWTWDDAHTAISKLNQTIAQCTQNVYTVLYFHKDNITIPDRGVALPNLKTFLADEYDHEQLVLIVNANRFIELLVQLASRIFQRQQLFAKFRFVRTLDDALKQIETHKTRQLTPNSL